MKIALTLYIIIQLNSLFPGRRSSNLRSEIFKLILQIGIMSISWEIELKWMPQIYVAI